MYTHAHIHFKVAERGLVSVPLTIWASQTVQESKNLARQQQAGLWQHNNTHIHKKLCTCNSDYPRLKASHRHIILVTMLLFEDSLAYTFIQTYRTTHITAPPQLEWTITLLLRRKALNLVVSCNCVRFSNELRLRGCWWLTNVTKTQNTKKCMHKMLSEISLQWCHYIKVCWLCSRVLSGDCVNTLTRYWANIANSSCYYHQHGIHEMQLLLWVYFVTTFLFW